ncbi:hypothetical protein ACWOA2_04800 [Granulicatella elegans]|uniref:Alanine--tRNA ligase n=1 Tax=Granulicatella elegans ATCC 700633 TaxID=626369 RepID=D0BK02_9LACT|nr:hypothetical protein [Granulicatella elegans]EEW93405.1 hypothetical protein HMPREF0446_00287 [Granulicatella elegans ATCC 700633]
MENDVSLYFREIMEKVGMDYIPDSGVMYHKTLKFSSVLNIEDRFEEFFKIDGYLYTNQRCFRVTDKILEITGVEGVASPYNHMLSFFLLKQENLENALKITTDFFRKLNFLDGKTTMVLSQKMLSLINVKTKGLFDICLINSDKLSTTLGEDRFKGEYIKFYRRNKNGLVPVGSLNVIFNGESYVIDSSFLKEVIEVEYFGKNSIYELNYFKNSFIQIRDKIPESILSVGLKCINLMRVILVLLNEGIVFGNKNQEYIVRKLHRILVLELFLLFLDKEITRSEIVELMSDITLSGLSDLQNVNTINYSNQFFLETIIKETEGYIELLEKGMLKISIQSFNLEDEIILKDRYGIPSKLIKRIRNGKLENKDDNIPMNPLNKVIDMPTKNWIKALHGE